MALLQTRIVLQSMEEDMRVPSASTSPAPTTTLSSADDLEPPQARRRAAPRPVSRKEILHTPEEWEEVRDLIRQLYIEENKTLVTVSRILETKHGFIATPKQYKIRFKQWGLWKNLSRRNANNLLQIKESRESLGKPSTFIRSGHKFDLSRIEKTIRRSKNRRTLNDGPPERLDATPGHASWPASSLPIGLECRTPSPVPRPDETPGLQLSSEDDPFGCGSPPRSWAPACDGFQTPSFMDAFSLDSALSTPPESCAVRLPGAELPPSASDQATVGPTSAHQGGARLDGLERCYYTSQRKLALGCERGLPPSSSADVELQTFQSRNALLAVLELAIGNRHRMAELFLCNFVGAFESHPHFSSFARLQVLPKLHELGPVRAVESAIDAAFASLGLSAPVRNMMEGIGARDARNEAALDEFGWQDANLEEYLDLSALSPTTYTEFSASEAEMPPTPSDDARNGSDESRLVGEFEGVAMAYHSGDDLLAGARLRSITADESVVTPKGKVLARLAWYCLSYLSGQFGMAEEAQRCLINAVQGSTYFRDDEGDEWQDVSYLFR